MRPKRTTKPVSKKIPADDDPKRPLVLLTGASEGIGRAMAHRLARQGARLMLVARNKARLVELVRELPGEGHGIHPADLSTERGMGAILSLIRARRPKVLINNAGSGVYAPFAEAKGDNLSAMTRLNIDAPMRLTHAFLEHAGEGHRILNIGSVLSYVPLPGNGTYAASKAFIATWTEALWFELRGRGIWAGVYCPGYTKTLFSSRALKQGLGERPEGNPPKVLRMEPDEVARRALAFMERAKGPVGIPGPWNPLLLLLPRILTRRALVRLMGRGWK